MESVKFVVVILLVALISLYGVTQGEEEEELFSRKQVDSGRLDSHTAEVEKQLNPEDFEITKKEPLRPPCGIGSKRCSRRRRRRRSKKKNYIPSKEQVLNSYDEMSLDDVGKEPHWRESRMEGPKSE